MELSIARGPPETLRCLGNSKDGSPLCCTSEVYDAIGASCRIETECARPQDRMIRNAGEGGIEAAMNKLRPEREPMMNSLLLVQPAVLQR
jgi:hypothetical protein